jgi:hypothetical protein
MATTTAITAVDEPGAVADYDRTTLDNTVCDDMWEVLLYVYAPSGWLGVVIDTLLRRWRGASALQSTSTPGTVMRMGRGTIRMRGGRRDFNAMGGGQQRRRQQRAATT